MFCIPRFGLTCASLLLVAPYAVAAQYNFINIADTRGPFEGFGIRPQAVSDTGAFAFIGNQGGNDGTYLGSGGAVQQVVPNLSDPAGFTALNESGVAVGRSECCNPRHSKIHLYNVSGASTVAEVMSGATFVAGFNEPVINNTGAVAFGTGMVDATATRGGLIRWVNGTSTTLVDFADGFRSVRNVAINELGDVAFTGATDLQAASVYRTDGTTLTPIAGPFQTTGPVGIATAINDSGAVAFWTTLDAGGEGIFVGDGGPLTTIAIADPTTPFYGFETDIDINNQGTVAFTARLWNGSFGIYAGSDPVNDKVVQIGDYIFGQRVSGLGRPHLNNRGDIAFWFRVLDPREPFGEWSGIALAVRESPLPGDFNQNGTVDAADYVVWRKGLGTIYTQNDYNDWRANFGATLGTGLGATGSASASANPRSPAIPETSTFVLAAVAVIDLVACFKRRR